MDRLRSMVEAGGVNLVLAQDRDRFAREPAYLFLLKTEFQKYGTELRSLNSSTDDTPEGELTVGVLDQLAKFERAKTAERTRRGKLSKTRQDKILATSKPKYGFRFNADRDGYEIDDETMPTVRRIFRMVAAGESLHSTAKALPDSWDSSTVRQIIKDDAYKPHGEDGHGIKWYNRYRYVSTKTLVPDGNGGKKTKRNTKKVERPRSEWIPIPVPNAGVPLATVEDARAGIVNNKAASRAGDRLWELDRGTARCGECGRHMTPHTVSPRGKTHYYYVCRHRRNHTCENSRNIKAANLEVLVADYVTELLNDADKLTAHIDALIEEETGRDPEPEIKACADLLADLRKERDGYIRLAAKDSITDDELNAYLTEVDERATNAEETLHMAQSRQERIDRLRQDKEILLNEYRNRAATGGLGSFTPDQRRELYRRMRLEVAVYRDGAVYLEGDAVRGLIYAGDRRMSWDGDDWQLEGFLHFGGVFQGSSG